jgi:hypothetical protein
MRPYGNHYPRKLCQCIQCGPDKKSKARKKSVRQAAKKEITNELRKPDKKGKMPPRLP